MTINKFTKTGAYHRALERENQDYFCGMEGEDYVCVMLADGATGCKKGLEGAKLSCQAVADIIEHEGTAFFNYPEKKIAYLLTEQILYYIECNKQETQSIREYGSTFMLAFMEKKTGRTVLINLGDGAVLSFDEEGKYFYRMKPKRYDGNPCLTTTEGAQKAIEVDVLNIPWGETLFLCTDGFLDMLNNKKVANLLNHYDTKELNQILLSEENDDDCSYISFTRKRQ